MGTAYTVGIFAGLGAALGVLAAGLLAPAGRAAPLALLAAAAAGAGLGLALGDWPHAVAGAAGGALGALGALQVVRGALRRGGTRGGTIALVALAALLLAALALVPGAGYLEAALLPLLAARLRRRDAQTYAGLRTLARD